MEQRIATITTPYYHGTSALGVVCISVEGFRLLHWSLRQWSDGALGSGIYVTALLETAALFAGFDRRSREKDAGRYIVKVRMSPGTRIMRLDGQYDPRVIGYLGREFGKEIYSPKFDRAIPANKHLSRTELINLANYLWDCGEDGKRGGIAAWSGLEGQGPLRRYLMKHKYDGVGCTDTDIGVVVFNPSRLLVDGMFQLACPAKVAADQQSANCLMEVDVRRLAREAAESIGSALKAVPELREGIGLDENGGHMSLARMGRDELAANLSEIPRQQACLRTFCDRHTLPMAEAPIASAAESYDISG